jgi:hypothetical protein
VVKVSCDNCGYVVPFDDEAGWGFGPCGTHREVSRERERERERERDPYPATAKNELGGVCGRTGF